jgi:DDE superfamily endonuclease
MYRPHNKDELFNLRHASARNIIECIFGVLKHRFHTLHIAPEYNLDIQAQIPTALCAIHNFITEHDTQEGVLPEARPVFDDDGPEEAMMELDDADAGMEAGIRHDQIVQEMWEDYLHVLHD